MPAAVKSNQKKEKEKESETNEAKVCPNAWINCLYIYT